MKENEKKLYLKIDCTVCGNDGSYCPYCSISLGKEIIEASTSQIVKVIKGFDVETIDHIIKQISNK